MISFAIRVRLSTVSAWLRNPACAVTSTTTSRLPSPPAHSMKSVIWRAANHQHGIDAHVDDAAVRGEAALRHEALHRAGGVFDREIAGFELTGCREAICALCQASRQAGKVPIFTAVREPSGKSRILSMSVAHGLGVMRAEKGERHVWQIQRPITR